MTTTIHHATIQSTLERLTPPERLRKLATMTRMIALEKDDRLRGMMKDVWAVAMEIHERLEMQEALTAYHAPVLEMPHAEARPLDPRRLLYGAVAVLLVFCYVRLGWEVVVGCMVLAYALDSGVRRHNNLEKLHQQNT